MEGNYGTISFIYMRGRIYDRPGGGCHRKKMAPPPLRGFPPPLASVGGIFCFENSWFL